MSMVRWTVLKHWYTICDLNENLRVKSGSSHISGYFCYAITVLSHIWFRHVTFQPSHFECYIGAVMDTVYSMISVVIVERSSTKWMRSSTKWMRSSTKWMNISGQIMPDTPIRWQ